MNTFLLGVPVLLGIFCLSKVESRTRMKRDFPEIKDVLDAHNNLRKLEKSSNMKKMVKLRLISHAPKSNPKLPTTRNGTPY